MTFSGWPVEPVKITFARRLECREARKLRGKGAGKPGGLKALSIASKPLCFTFPDRIPGQPENWQTGSTF
jgi:hypothetical protein